MRYVLYETLAFIGPGAYLNERKAGGEGVGAAYDQWGAQECPHSRHGGIPAPAFKTAKRAGPGIWKRGEPLHEAGCHYSTRQFSMGNSVSGGTQS